MVGGENVSLLLPEARCTLAKQARRNGEACLCLWLSWRDMKQNHRVGPRPVVSKTAEEGDTATALPQTCIFVDFNEPDVCIGSGGQKDKQ